MHSQYHKKGMSTSHWTPVLSWQDVTCSSLQLSSISYRRKFKNPTIPYNSRRSRESSLMPSISSHTWLSLEPAGSPVSAPLSPLQPWMQPVTLTSLSFCQHHRPTSKEHEEAWLLQRDITYALILPVLEIYRHAAQLARSMLGDRNIFDLELVFRGDARGAFAWLQCFITEEEEWCSTRGCPGTSIQCLLLCTH